MTITRRILLLAAIGLAGAGAFAYALDRPDGYGASVDFRTVIPPPPEPQSAAANADRAAFARTTAGIGGAAWREAGAQVFPTSPDVTAQISCLLGHQISPATTPVTARLMADVAADLRRPVEAAKAYHQRDRPFVGAADTRTCDPRTLGPLGRTTGGTLTYAYPSGHAANGRLWARTLAAVAPDRAASLAAWGNRLGDNRIVCRVHWPSDVAAGRRLADAMFVQLDQRAAFRADIAAARRELATAPPARGC